METVLEVRGLNKRYKQVKAVDGLNMTIKRGDIYGFLGQNGAGKTTAIRMIMGLVKPDAGEIALLGEKVRPGRSGSYRQVGSIIEFPGFYPNLTAAENLDISRRLMGVGDKRCINEALETVGLAEARNRRAGQFSLGMKQRLGIARAILHSPEFLVLDEPTNGLDPVGIKEIRQLIQELVRQRNITVLISSHILGEVEQLATRVGIIHKGVMLEETELAKLAGSIRQYIEIRVDQPNKAIGLLQREMQIEFMVEEGTLRVFGKLSESARMNRILLDGGVEVSELALRKDSLEDYFIRLIGGESVG